MIFPIFVLVLIFLCVALFYGLFKGDFLFTIVSFGLCIGLWGILNAQGIEVVSQITSAGVLVYTAKTAANDLGVAILSWFCLGFALISFTNFLSLSFSKKPLYRVG